MRPARLLYLHAISPIHTGTGQTVEVIDLPIAREKTTNWPILPGSSLKGVLRAACEDSGSASLVAAAFGAAPAAGEDSGGNAGGLLFGDGRLLCLPVRSLFGTFAWVTSPLAIDRYRRDLIALGLAAPPALAALPAFSEVLLATPAASPLTHNNTVYLGDLDLAVGKTDCAAVAEHIGNAVFAADSAWQEQLHQRLAVVHDTVFAFLAETATEVVARIALSKESKTVATGALWYEEAIPTEAIFVAPILAETRGAIDAEALFGLVSSQNLIQLGGDSTIGRGLMRLAWSAGQGGAA